GGAADRQAGRRPSVALVRLRGRLGQSARGRAIADRADASARPADRGGRFDPARGEGARRQGCRAGECQRERRGAVGLRQRIQRATRPGRQAQAREERRAGHRDDHRRGDDADRADAASEGSRAGRSPAPDATATPRPSPPAGVRPPTPARPTPSLAVTISAPRDQSRFEQASAALAGFAAGGRGPRRLVVTLNGREVARREESAPASSLAFHAPVTLREGQNTLVVTATDGEGATQQEARTVYYEKVVPLSIAVRYPDDKARVEDETTVVAALVTGSKGIALVRVDLNGSEVSRVTGAGPSQKSMAVTAPAKLREGVNVVVVSATDSNGMVRQDIRTITYTPPSAPAAAPASRPAP